MEKQLSLLYNFKILNLHKILPYGSQIKKSDTRRVFLMPKSLVIKRRKI